jgi:hypothetical protein
MDFDQELDIIVLVNTTWDTAWIASNIGRIGKKADEDNLKVIETGEPILEVHISGKRFNPYLTFLFISYLFY